MSKLFIEIFSGDWIIETADVQTVDGKIVDVTLHSGRHQPVNASTVESQRKFWTEEYTRLGWTFTPHQMIAKGIGTMLIDVNIVHESEDHWIDAAFEDRHEMAGF